jgi:hypothetical protein
MRVPVSGYRCPSAWPGFRRLDVLGAEYRVRGDTIFAGLLTVHVCPLPVFLYVAAVRTGEHFV